MANTIYTVGFQPIDIVTRKLQIVDVINFVTTKGLITNNIRQDVTNYLNSLEFTMDDSDYILLNSAHNVDIINGLARPQTYVFDPGLSTTEKEIMQLLQNLSVLVGSNDIERTYNHKANSIRASLFNVKGLITPSQYFNALTLLSDLNGGQPEVLSEHISSFKARTTTDTSKDRKRAIFVGDVINPSFFDYLENNGVDIVSYFPYEIFLRPVTNISEDYYSNAYFQRMLIHMKCEIRAAMLESNAYTLILNPGGVYLTTVEAEHLVESLKTEAVIYNLPGTYDGVTLAI